MNALKKGHPELVQTTTGDLAMLIAAYMVDQYKWTKSGNLVFGQIQNPAFTKGGWVLSLRGNAVTWVDTRSSVAPTVASLGEFIALMEEVPLRLGGELLYIEDTGVRYGATYRVPWAQVQQIYQRLTGKDGTASELKKVVPQFIEVTSPELAVAAAAYMKQRHGFIRAPQLRGGDEQLLKQAEGVTLRLLPEKEIRWHGGLGAARPALRARTLAEFIALVEEMPSGGKIHVAGYDCEFKAGGVQIGCQFVTTEMVKTALDRMPKKA